MVMGSGAGSPVDATTARSSGMSDLAVPTFLPEVLPAVEVGWRFTPSVWGHGHATEGAAPERAARSTAFRYSHTVSVPTTGRCRVAGSARDALRVEAISWPSPAPEPAEYSASIAV